jgi:TatD DNase family protein
VHLHAYDDAAVVAMLDRARVAGVERIVAVAVDLPSARRTLELAAHHPEQVVAAVGLHPGHLTEMPDDATWAALEQLAEHPMVRAIGECGVEGVDGRASGLIQLAALSRHARLARGLGKPLLLHLRGDDLVGPALGVLASAGVAAERAVVHYFVGNRELAERYLAAGLIVALGKPVTRIENEELRAAVRTIPLERLLLETDTYPLPGRTTEPSDVRLVAEAVAELKGVSLEEVAHATCATLARLLG